MSRRRRRILFLEKLAEARLDNYRELEARLTAVLATLKIRDERIADALDALNRIEPVDIIESLFDVRRAIEEAIDALSPPSYSPVLAAEGTP